MINSAKKNVEVFISSYVVVHRLKNCKPIAKRKAIRRLTGSRLSNNRNLKTTVEEIALPLRGFR
jgi:hypothetical protein